MLKSSMPHSEVYCLLFYAKDCSARSLAYHAWNPTASSSQPCHSICSSALEIAVQTHSLLTYPRSRIYNVRLRYTKQHLPLVIPLPPIMHTAPFYTPQQLVRARNCSARRSPPVLIIYCPVSMSKQRLRLSLTFRPARQR